MSTTDSFLPDPDRRIRDSDEELAHEVRGDGPDVFAGDAGAGDASTGESGAGESSDAKQELLHPNPLFRTPHAGERLTAEQLEKEVE
jgi:hypothetical protein